ncbi:hypothetical protein GXW82_41185 [Streptacidiphilus sp. 4-A2]|nr:hypothetical protein [Streptacidiphilus sp. 4-A2]
MDRGGGQRQFEVLGEPLGAPALRGQHIGGVHPGVVGDLHPGGGRELLGVQRVQPQHTVVQRERQQAAGGGQRAGLRGAGSGVPCGAVQVGRVPRAQGLPQAGEAAAGGVAPVRAGGRVVECDGHGAGTSRGRPDGGRTCRARPCGSAPGPGQRRLPDRSGERTND